MWKIFLIILLSYVTYFFLLPPFQNPDEQAHFEVIYWFSHGIYPIVPKDTTHIPHPGDIQQTPFKDTVQQKNNKPNYEKIKASTLLKQTNYPKEIEKQFLPLSGQAYNPPLYYFIGTLFLSAAKFIHISLINQIYFVRLTSTVFYFTTLLFAYKLLNVLFKETKIIIGIFLLFALNPLFIQSGIGISPDIAVMCFCTVFFYLVLKHQRNLELKHIVLLAFITAFASLSKVTGIVLIPAFIMYLLLQFKFKKDFFIFSGILLLTFFAVNLPWLLLNFARYHTFIMAIPAFGLPEKNVTFLSAPNAAIQTIWGFRHIFMHYTGFIGWNEAFPPTFVFIPLTIIFIFSSILGILSAWKENNNYKKFLIFAIIFLFLFFFCLDFVRKLYFHPGWEIGGRNALPIFLPLLIFSITGASKLLKVNLIKISNFLAYFSIAYFYYIIFFILIPRYY